MGETFQIPREAAEAYEATFVPRLFGEWAGLMVDAADVRPDDRVLDVATGTGVVARAATERGCSVTGVDLNQAMIDVARKIAPDIEWKQGDAQSLPFDDASFDAVLCQAGMMFFPDPDRALAEMARVAVPSGTVAVQVWDRLEQQAPYAALTEIASKQMGAEAADLLGAYFAMGDRDRLIDRMAGAGLQMVKADTRETTMRFASLEEFFETEVASTPLAERLDAKQQRTMLEDARDVLGPFMTGSGEAHIPIRGHIAIARRRT